MREERRREGGKEAGGREGKDEEEGQKLSFNHALQYQVSKK